MNTEIKRNALPLSALESDRGREAVRQADVIFGHDLSRDELNVFWGRATLRKIANSGKAAGLAIVAFQYDQRDDSLERLCAAITVLRGACSYLADE